MAGSSGDRPDPITDPATDLAARAAARAVGPAAGPLADAEAGVRTATLAVFDVLERLYELHDAADHAEFHAAGLHLLDAFERVNSAGAAGPCMIFWGNLVAALSAGGPPRLTALAAPGSPPDLPAGAAAGPDADPARDPDDPRHWRHRLQRLASYICTGRGYGWAVVDELRTGAAPATGAAAAGTVSVGLSLAASAYRRAAEVFGGGWRAWLADAPQVTEVFLRHHLMTVAWAAELGDQAARVLELGYSAGYAAHMEPVTSAGPPPGPMPAPDAVGALVQLLEAALIGHTDAYAPPGLVENVLEVSVTILAWMHPGLADAPPDTDQVVITDIGGGAPTGVSSYPLGQVPPHAPPEHRHAAVAARLVVDAARGDEGAYSAGVDGLRASGEDAVTGAATAAVAWVGQVCQQVEAGMLAR